MVPSRALVFATLRQEWTAFSQCVARAGFFAAHSDLLVVKHGYPLATVTRKDEKERVAFAVREG